MYVCDVMCVYVYVYVMCVYVYVMCVYVYVMCALVCMYVMCVPLYVCMYVCALVCVVLCIVCDVVCMYMRIGSVLGFLLPDLAWVSMEYVCMRDIRSLIVSLEVIIMHASITVGDDYIFRYQYCICDVVMDAVVDMVTNHWPFLD